MLTPRSTASRDQVEDTVLDLVAQVTAMIIWRLEITAIAPWIWKNIRPTAVEVSMP